ncbi:MAG: hypothetical protein ABI564_12700 [Ideonella sp.]
MIGNSAQQASAASIGALHRDSSVTESFCRLFASDQTRSANLLQIYALPPNRGVELMKVLIRLFAAFVLACGLIAPAAALQPIPPGKVLYFYDSFNGTNFWTPAFVQRGDTVTTVTSASGFVTQLAQGPWDFVVVSENNFDTSSTYGAALVAYIAAGNRVVFNNWYQNAAFDTAFEATVGSPLNQTGITVNNPLGVALTLTNAGWGVFSQTLTPTGTGQSICSFATGSCAVLGNSGRTIRLGLIPDGLPAGQGAAFLVALLGTTSPPVGAKTFEQNIACARDQINLLTANQVTGPAQRNLMNTMLGSVLAYRSGYPSLTLGLLDSVIVRTDGCPLRTTPDTVASQGGTGADYVTNCQSQAAIYACLKGARDQLVAPVPK